MKKILLIIVAFILSATISFAADTESVSPSYSTEIQRKVSEIDIEGTTYSNVVITFKSGDIFSSKVSVKIKNSEGKTIYKKTFKGAYLYIFRDGQIQVGKKNFDKIVITRSYLSDSYKGKIREKEGVYY